MSDLLMISTKLLEKSYMMKHMRTHTDNNSHLNLLFMIKHVKLIRLRFIKLRKIV